MNELKVNTPNKIKIILNYFYFMCNKSSLFNQMRKITI